MTTLPYGRPLTREDLASLPDDGHRYELLDGSLIVTPAPSPLHQLASGRLYRVLDDAAPAELLVLYAPVDVVLGGTTVLQPDIVVAARRAFSERDLPVAPMLAVEILSPSTSRLDLLLKYDRYRSAGCPHYWVVDPAEPSVRAWRLDGDAFVEAGHAVGDDVLELGQPFRVRIRPTDLVR